ncbi:MAG: hypothetical protein IJK31_02090 [Ruminococcus sp.]|nr:hypothetical protein [Ruminococcus sp.]HRR76682.1 hypothetical protein [Ruminococcus sp.]
MIINKTDIVTKVSELTDLSGLCSADLGSPALLIVQLQETASPDEKTRDFLRNAPFITAAVGDISDSGLRSVFDLVISDEEAALLPEKLYKDKSRKQIDEINAIFTAARKGASQEELLAMESRAFYRLMADKNGGSSNE